MKRVICVPSAVNFVMAVMQAAQ